MANPDCFYHQESEKPRIVSPAAGVHAHVVGAVTTLDESSDSDAEQEGPQKLIRKVSTSGQLRSKVRHLCFLWGF